MNAIDLFSGIGGWTLGLKLAGIDVLASYDWWSPANETHGRNFGKTLPNVDIRQMDISCLPQPCEVDFVVGSPPCTQFSFSNRGGNGDLEDGLVDIRRMLQIIEYLKPRYWVMENVPRVSQILKKELAPQGSLEHFASLVTVNEVFNMEEFGLPQARSRMVAGHFPVHLLKSYRGTFGSTTLAQVVDALRQDEVIDPLYGYRLSQIDLTDHVLEVPLNEEETRMNRESKSYHPVYNRMTFPDSLDRPARTITATCTRVSRESIVIHDPKLNGFRRLTLRERALLQGFPITYQFFGRNYSDRLKMIGNAVPPFFTYQLAMALRDTPRGQLIHPRAAKYQHVCMAGLSNSLQPDLHAPKYGRNRRFRSAVPGLRFGSGVRFELANSFSREEVYWAVDLYYGTSKAIIRANLEQHRIERALKEYVLEGLLDTARSCMSRVLAFTSQCGPSELQDRWTKRTDGVGPFQLVDLIGAAVREFRASFSEEDLIIATMCARGLFPGMNSKKTADDLVLMLAGAICASIFNLAAVGAEHRPSPAEWEGEAFEGIQR